MHKILLVCVLILPLVPFAQTNLVTSGYTQCSWSHITLEDSSFTSTDSSVVFATTRTWLAGNSKEFLGNEIASDSIIRFFQIYFHGNEWKAVPRKSLAKGLDQRTGPADFVIYTEGDGKTFPDNLDRSTRLTRLYGISVVMFDWPSRVPGLGQVKNVRNTVRNTKLLAREFHSFMLQLNAYKTQNPGKIAHTTLFFHSLGNALFKNSVQITGTGDYGSSLADNIILNAACVPTRNHATWVDILGFQKHLYIISNRKDKTLREAGLLFGKRLLGITPGRCLSSQAIYLNIHPLVARNHNYFLLIPVLKMHPGIASFYRDVFHGNEFHMEDSARFKKDGKYRIYTLK